MRLDSAALVLALVLAATPSPASAADHGTRLIPSIGVGAPAGWPGAIVPRMTADANAGSTLTVSDTLFSGQPTWFSYCTYKNPAVCATWTDALAVDNTTLDLSTNSNCDWAMLYFPHLNCGPAIVRGGRHTVTAYADLYSQTGADYDRRNTPISQQFVWSPEPLPAGIVTTSATPPPPTTDDVGYQLDRPNASAFVVSGVTDNTTDDVVLRVFTDPWLGSESGFTAEGAGSAQGPGEVNFVAGSGAGTPASVYPAVSAWTNGAAGGYSLSWADATGRRDSSAAARWTGSLGAMRMASVYEVWLQTGVPFRATLTRSAGNDDLALAIGPPAPGSYWSRYSALGNSSPVGGSAGDSLAFLPTETGWHPLVVYRVRSTDRAAAQDYVLQFGAGTTSVHPLPARFFLSAPPVAASEVRFAFGLPGAGPARLAIYDAQGRRVRTLLDAPFEAGTHEVTWDLRDATGARAGPGGYWARLETASGRRTSRVMVVR